MEIVTDIQKLRKECKPVSDSEDVTKIVEALLTKLEESTKEVPTVGLSANQLGFNKRICIIKAHSYPPMCFVNPVIIKERGHCVRGESCLSLPDTLKTPILVRRPKGITVRGVNQYGKSFRYKLSGFEARVACHEIDHLNGKLIIDYE